MLQGLDLLRDLLAIEPAVILNAAFCERHLQRCPQHEHLQACTKVLTLRKTLSNQCMSRGLCSCNTFPVAAVKGCVRTLQT